MIELFSDNTNPSNSYNHLVLQSLFLQNREDTQKPLKVKMYSALLRGFLQSKLDGTFDKKILTKKRH